MSDDVGAAARGEHLTFDELADLDEGLLAPERAVAARAHLTRCEQCRSRSHALAAARNALHDLEPVEMPADVAARIDRALAGAAADPSAEVDDPAPAPATTTFQPDAPGTVVPDLGAVRRRRRVPTMPTAAAAVVVALAVTAIAVGLTDHSKPGSPSGGAGQAASPEQPPLVGQAPGLTPATFTVASTGRVYTPATLATLVPQLVSDAAVRAAGSQPPNTLSNGTATTSAPSATGGSGTKYGATEGSSAPKHHKTGKAARSGTLSTSGHPGRTGTAPLSAPTRLPSSPIPPSLVKYETSRRLVLQCSSFITDTAGAVPEAVDLGRWTDSANHRRATPALILVFADRSNSALVHVYVVAPACGGDSLLLEEELPASR